MPRSNTAGVSNAGPVEETHVLTADGTQVEVNKTEEEVSPSPGSNSSASLQSSASTKTSRGRKTS